MFSLNKGEIHSISFYSLNEGFNNMNTYDFRQVKKCYTSLLVRQLSGPGFLKHLKYVTMIHA